MSFLSRQRLFDKGQPGSCLKCGMLVCFAPSKNGVQCKFELDENSNPTFAMHKCPAAKSTRIDTLAAAIEKKMKKGGTSKIKLRLPH